jgi:hypothetical protein
MIDAQGSIYVIGVMFGTYEEYVSFNIWMLFSIWIIPVYSIVPIEIAKVPIGLRGLLCLFGFNVSLKANNQFLYKITNHRTKNNEKMKYKNI